MLISFIVMVSLLIILCIFQNHIFFKFFNKKALLIILAPGVMIHELSHAFSCLIVGAKIKKIKLFSLKGNTLGYVSHTKPKIPILGQFLISIAPLIGCSLFLYFLAVLTNFPTDFNYTLSLKSKDAFTEFFKILKDAIDYISITDLKNWRTWFFLYFALSLSSSIAPSSKDFKNMLPNTLILGFIIYIIYRVGNGASPFDKIANLFFPLLSFGILMVVIALFFTIPLAIIIKIIK